MPKKVLTMQEFGKLFKIGSKAVNSAILHGRLRAVNCGNGESRAAWMIPQAEVQRWRQEGYYPRKHMPVVVPPAEVERLRHPQQQLPPVSNAETDAEIRRTAERLLELVEQKLTQLADLSEFAERCRNQTRT